MLRNDHDGKGALGSFLSGASLSPVSLEDRRLTAAKTVNETQLLPLISQVLAPLMEQSQAIGLAVKRIEQSIASLTTERAEKTEQPIESLTAERIERMEQSVASFTAERLHVETTSLLAGCLERAVDDIRLQANVLRTTHELASNNLQNQKQLLEKHHVPVECAAETGGTGMSASAAVTFDELTQAALNKQQHSPLQQQPQQQQQTQQPQKKQGMMTDIQESQWAQKSKQTKTLDSLQVSEQARTRIRERHTRRQRKRLSLRNTNANVRMIRTDAASLENEASLSIAKAFFSRLGGILDWWANRKEPTRSGPLSKFLHSRTFDIVVGCVITANSVTMTRAANQNMTTLDKDPYMYAEWCFVFLYVLELSAKLAVHGAWLFCNDAALWNMFDFVIVFSSLYDVIVDFVDTIGVGTGVKTAKPGTGQLNLRILRLIRVVRMLKLLRVFSEARRLVNAVLSSFLNLLWGLLGVVFMLYMFALMMVHDLIAFREENRGHVELDQERAILDNFGSVQRAMLSLFKSVTTGEVWNTYLQILSPFSGFLLVFFVTLMHFEITAILLYNTESIRKPDALTQAYMDQAKSQKESEELRQLLMLADHDNSGCVSARDLRDLVKADDEIEIQLCSLGVDIEDGLKFFDLMVERLPNGHKTDDVEIDRFVEACMRMKGSAKNVTQETLLMETRAFCHSQAEHNLYMKNWQMEVNQKLDRLSGHH